MMKFLVKQQKIEALEREVIASDQIAFVSVKFMFDGAWKTLHKVVQFTQCEETYNVVLGTEGTTCLLPAELHPGAVKMSLFGYDAEKTGRKGCWTSKWKRWIFSKSKGGANEVWCCNYHCRCRW